ncbi:MAG: fibronectin type III domain-containing protein [Pseudomonadota bacterium]
MSIHRFQVGLTAALACLATLAFAHSHGDGDAWTATEFPLSSAFAPTPLPDRVVLTWSDDPTTTQSVTWRTDTSIKHGVGEIALASANGRAMETTRFGATLQAFESDVNEAHYHTLTFRNLEPDTLYAYRVGDGVNWTEFYQFKTASTRPTPFRFVYFGDAQNDVRTHWSRVFREAFRDAPRAAFMLHAGDLINENTRDVEWGEWHGAAGWVNGTIPIIATPGNHEYFRENQGPRNERIWTRKDGSSIPVDVQASPIKGATGTAGYDLKVTTPDGDEARMAVDGGGVILEVDEAMAAMTGFTAEELVGTKSYKAPLLDRLRNPGSTPVVSKHWRPQFEFPVQDVPRGLEETVYYIDYQGTRFISLDSNRDIQAQVPWLRKTLENNPNRWTVLTFHHPVFSPTLDRDNAELRAAWKPLIDEFRVDLVLTGHDHTYARTGIRDAESMSSAEAATNIPSGYQQAYDPEIGTVYVVSVSGPKMYPVGKTNFARRVAENTQLYQVIDIADGALEYRAYTPKGELYDAFTLEKREGAANRLLEALPPERRGS